MSKIITFIALMFVGIFCVEAAELQQIPQESRQKCLYLDGDNYLLFFIPTKDESPENDYNYSCSDYSKFADSYGVGFDYLIKTSEKELGNIEIVVVDSLYSMVKFADNSSLNLPDCFRGNRAETMIAAHKKNHKPVIFEQYGFDFTLDYFCNIGFDNQVDNGNYLFNNMGLACYNGDLEQVKKLVDAGVDISQTALFFMEWAFDSFFCAIRNNQIEVAKYLIEQGVNPQRGYWNGDSAPLNIIASLKDGKASVELAKMLIERGAHIDGRIDEHLFCITPPIESARECKNSEYLKFLEEEEKVESKKFQIKSRDKCLYLDGDNYLLFFIPTKDESPENDYNYSCSDYSKFADSYGGFDTLMEYSKNESANIEIIVVDSIYSAVEFADNSSLDIPTCFKGSRVETMIAAHKNRHKPIVFHHNLDNLSLDYFSNEGFDNQISDCKYLFDDLGLACYNGDLERVKKLVSVGADVEGESLYFSGRDFDSFYCAVINNQIEVAKYLIEQGSNPEREYWDGDFTPLNIIASLKDGKASVELAKMLIERGAKVNQYDDSSYRSSCPPSVSADIWKNSEYAKYLENF